jgi:hypothetical protein
MRVHAVNNPAMKRDEIVEVSEIMSANAHPSAAGISQKQAKACRLNPAHGPSWRSSSAKSSSKMKCRYRKIIGGQALLLACSYYRSHHTSALIT